MRTLNPQSFNNLSKGTRRGLTNFNYRPTLTRVPNGVKIPSWALPNNHSLPMATRVAREPMRSFGYQGYDATPAQTAAAQARQQARLDAQTAKGVARKQAAQAKQAHLQAVRQAKVAAVQAKQQAKIAAITGKTQAVLNTAQAPVDYTQVTTMTPVIQPGVDASLYVAPNIPTLPAITNAQIRREKRNLKKTEKAINQLNKLNAIRDQSGASLSLGLNAPVDYTQVQQGYLPGTVSDPNAGMMQQQPYYPPQAGYPQYPQAPMPSYPMPSYPMPGGGGQGGPVFSSQIMGEQQYAPFYPEPYQIEPAWQESVPFDLPMTESGDLLFMQPNDEQLDDMNTSERFAEYFDGDPLDSYLAFSADPAPSGMTNFFTGLTQAVAGGVKSAADYNTARYTAKTNLTQAQLEARKRPAPPKSNNTLLLVGGAAALGLIIWAAARK